MSEESKRYILGYGELIHIFSWKLWIAIIAKANHIKNGLNNKSKSL